MKVLILDDDHKRHFLLDDILKGNDVTHVYDYLSAVLALKEEKYDLVFLDYKLSNGRNSGILDAGKELTGYNVAVVMATELLTDNKPKWVISHSTDEFGGSQIGKYLNSNNIKCSVLAFNGQLFSDFLIAKKADLESAL